MDTRTSTCSRATLLSAATAAFAKDGYQGTTTRRIGSDAGLDPSLVARYFRNKAALYQEVVRSEASRIKATQRTLGDDEVRSAFVAYSSPTLLLAVLDRHEDMSTRDTVAAALDSCAVGPIRDLLYARGIGKSQLRASIALAAVAGISAARSSGTLDELGTASDDAVIALIGEILRSLFDSDVGFAQ